MRYQVDFLLPLKLQKMPYYFGLCQKILLANQFVEFFTFDLFGLLILMLGSIAALYLFNIALDIFLKVLKDEGMHRCDLFSQEELNIENVLPLLKRVSLFHSHDSSH